MNPPPPNQNPGTRLHYLAYRAIEKLAALIPQFAQYRIADIASDVYFKLDSAARENLVGNLRKILPDETAPAEIRAIARESFRSFGRYVCEFIGQRSLDPKFLDSARITGREHVEAALALGRGAIFCSAHYSNWELGPSLVARMGFPVIAIVQQHAVPQIDALFIERRARAGVNVVHSQSAALRALKALRQNQTVAILGDRPTGGPLVRAQFFGRITGFPQGPWRLARLSGAPLLPTFVYRDNEKYRMNIGPPITVSGYTDDNAAVGALAQSWAKLLEARVRGDPSQWAAFYPVWSADEKS